MSMLPPGNEGLPLLGETLAFAKNPFRFIEERLARHGRVFRSSLLGRKAVVVSGPEAASQFIDPELIAREGSMPPHVQELFGGRSLPLLDGDAHRGRKTLVLQAFSRAALGEYLPGIQSATERYAKAWTDAGEIRWLDEMKRLAIEVICTTVLGMAPGPEIDQLREDYATLTGGFASLPVNLPGTRYRKALQARNRILDTLRAKVRERRANPRQDGLSRILGASVSSGTPLSDEEATLEAHHIVIAGYIVYAELGAMIQQLTAHPEVRASLAEEIASKAQSGALTLEQLVTMHQLMQVVSEVKRLAPIVPAVFGKAKTSFEMDGKMIPAGWMVMWALRPSHVENSRYTDPERFDPARFSPERAEDKRHEHAFAPQGAGPAMGHRCPGVDFATYVMAVFAIVVLRHYTWELPPQSFEVDWSKTPPDVVDGLRAVVRRA